VRGKGTTVVGRTNSVFGTNERKSLWGVSVTTRNWVAKGKEDQCGKSVKWTTIPEPNAELSWDAGVGQPEGQENTGSNQGAEGEDREKRWERPLKKPVGCFKG